MVGLVGFGWLMGRFSTRGVFANIDHALAAQSPRELDQ
jgi:hypothetical protein